MTSDVFLELLRDAAGGFCMELGQGINSAGADGWVR